MKKTLKAKCFPLKSPQIITAVLSTLFIAGNTCVAQALPEEVMVDAGTLGANSYPGSIFVTSPYVISADGSVFVGMSATSLAAPSRAVKYEGGVITDLGTLSGTFSSYATGVSADGSVIVGAGSRTAGGDGYAFKYQNGVFTDLGSLTGRSTYATAVSADGQVIIGYSFVPRGFFADGRAFKYVGTTMTDIGSLGSGASRAYYLSADGAVVVGDSGTSTGETHAFKHTDAGGMVDLGTLGGNRSTSAGVSADGSVIVGRSYIAGSIPINHAFKHTDADGMVDLGTLGGTESIAHGISADGSVIVGQAQIGGDAATHAFKYTDADGMVNLGTLGGRLAYAAYVSADGSVIAGNSEIPGNTATHPFYYKDGSLIDMGTLGGNFAFVKGISADGQVIVGQSLLSDNTTYHAFIYRVKVAEPLPPEAPPSSLVDVNNTYTALASNSYQLNSVLNTQANLLNVGLNNDCTLFGANNTCVGIGGTYNTVNRSKASQTTINLRAAYQATPNFHVGVFADQSATNSMPSNYDLRNNMPLVGVFAGWSENNNGLGIKVKGSVAYSKRNLDITRSTLANTEAGKGSSKLTTQGAQLEAAYGIALNNTWSAEPFLGVRVSEISRGAYQENNVDFPISYNAVKQTATTAYAGARFTGQITPAISARLSAGVESDLRHRISDHTGTIDFLGPYALNAPKVSRTRGFASGSLSYAIAPNQAINAGVAVGQDALNDAVGVAASLNYVMSF